MSAAPSMPPALMAAESERAVIGAVLVDPALFGAVTLSADDFAMASNRAVWRALCRLDEAGSPIDLVTLSRDLEKRGELHAAGGASYLGSLPDGVPRVSSANVEAHEGIVREASRKRACLAAGERMQALARAGDVQAADVLEEGMRLLQETAAAVGSEVTLDPEGQVKGALRWLEESGRGKATGWRTGLPALDAKLGPLQPGQLVLVAGRTGLGKSTMLANLGDAIAAEGGPVLLFSAEMGDREINVRRLLAEAGVPASHFEHGGITPSTRDWEAVGRAAGVLSARPFFVEASAPSPLEARAKARMVKARRGLAAVLFDYLQLFPAGPGRRGETREAEVARVSRALKRLAMDLNVLVIAASQLNRSGDQRKDGRPRLSDLRESGAQEQDADVVLLLHRDEGDDDERTEVIVAKHRHRGRGSARLRFEGATYRFGDSESGE